MNTPLPTPYDIIDPVGHPFSPGLSWWIVLAALIVLYLLFAFLLRSLQQKKKPPRSSLRIACDTLRSLRRSSSADAARALDQASLVVRRVLSARYNPELSAMTAAELTAFSESAPPSVQPLIEALVQSEQLRYRPRISSDECMNILAHLADNLEVLAQGEVRTDD